MELLELEHSFDQAYQAWQNGDLAAGTFLRDTRRWVDRAHAIGSPDGFQVAYRMRLQSLAALSEIDRARHIHELRDLLRIHRNNPQAYPAQIGTSSGDLLGFNLDLAAAHAPFDPAVPAEMIEATLTLVDDYFADPGHSKHLRIAAYQAMDRSEVVLPMLEGYLTREEDFDGDTHAAAEWLQRHDLAAMAYLEQGYLDVANQVILETEKSRLVVGSQPVAMLAESLLWLAEHVDINTTVRRLRYVLQHGVAKRETATSAVQAATFLALGGLIDEALSLAAQTEALFVDPHDAVNEYYQFFRAMEQVGAGDRRLARFGAPRWQDALYVDPQHVTCSDLKDVFAAPARAEANAFDQRNGTTKRASWLERSLSAPRLDRDWFSGTFFDFFAPGIDDTEAFPGPETRFDDALVSFAQVLWSVPGLEEKIELPAFIRDNPDAYGLYNQAIGASEIGIGQYLDRIIAAADDPGAQVRERQFWELAAFLMVKVIHSEEYTEEFFDVAARALPLVIVAGDGQGQLSAYLFAYRMRMRDGIEMRHSRAYHSALDMVVGLSASGVTDYPELASYGTVFGMGGRPIDAQAVELRAITMLADDPGVTRDPDSARIHHHAAAVRNFQAVGCYADAGQEAYRGALLAKKIGDQRRELKHLTDAADCFWRAGNYSMAFDLYNSTQLGEDTSLEQRCDVLATGMRVVAVLDDGVFEQEWPTMFGQYSEAMDEQLAANRGGRMYGELRLLQDEITEVLISRDALSQARELAAWAVARVADHEPELDEIGENYLELLFNALGTQSSVLAYSGMHDESALVLESLVQRMNRYGDSERAQRAEAILGRFASNGQSPAYQEVIDNLG